MQHKDQWDYLQNFLNKWTVDKISNMSLSEYVKSGVADTFANSVEDRSGRLGQIGNPRGIRMYGICQPKPETYSHNWEPEFTYNNASGYAWKHFLGDNETDVFNIIREQILKIIDISRSGDLKKLFPKDAHDPIYCLDHMFKLKIAFMYQDFNNLRILPVYSWSKLSEYLNNTDESKTIIDFYNTIIKQENISSFDEAIDFAEALFDNPLCDNIEYKSNEIVSKRKESQPRVLPGHEYQEIHSKIQRALRDELLAGGWQVSTETFHRKDKSKIDLVAIKDEEIVYYEIKSYESAIDTIREALGQLLEYWLYKKSPSYKIATKLVIVGPTADNSASRIFLKYLREKHNIPVYYRQFVLSPES